MWVSFRAVRDRPDAFADSFYAAILRCAYSRGQGFEQLRIKRLGVRVSPGAQVRRGAPRGTPLLGFKWGLVGLAVVTLVPAVIAVPPFVVVLGRFRSLCSRLWSVSSLLLARGVGWGPGWWVLRASSCCGFCRAPFLAEGETVAGFRVAG